MKKLYLILCAGILAFAAVSCKQDVQPAKPMSGTEIKQKLANTAVDALKEVDPDNWEDWFKTATGLYNAIREVERGNLNDFSDDMEDAMVSVETKDEKTFITTLIKLSLVKGDITVVNNAFVYTKSDKQLSITYAYNGKTYKAQLESEGENSDGITITKNESESEVRTVKAVIPAKAAVRITENGNLFLNVIVTPAVEDKNKNGMLDEADAIKGSATIQIPDYELVLNDLYISDDNVKAAVRLSHSGKSVLAIEGQATMDLLVERVKALAEFSINYIPKDVTGNISVLGGTALLRANANVEKLLNVGTHYESEADAKKAAETITKNLKADLYFDNNPTIQASLCVIVEKNISSGWDVIAGIHLYDGSADVPASEFFDLSEDVWKPVSGEFNAFVAKINSLLKGNAQ
jgi:hypothetical protein